MIPQVSAILGGVSMVLVILAIKALITPYRISYHLIRPFEKRLVFNLLQNLLYWFSKHSINHLGVSRSQLPKKVFLRLIVIVLVWLEISPLLRDHLSLSFPFPCSWSSLTLLYLSIRFISWRTLATGLPVRDFLKSCSTGRSALKVLMVTSS